MFFYFSVLSAMKIDKHKRLLKCRLKSLHVFKNADNYCHDFKQFLAAFVGCPRYSDCIKKTKKRRQVQRGFLVFKVV